MSAGLTTRLPACMRAPFLVVSGQGRYLADEYCQEASETMQERTAHFGGGGGLSRGRICIQGQNPRGHMGKSNDAVCRRETGL